MSYWHDSTRMPPKVTLPRAPWEKPDTPSPATALTPLLLVSLQALARVRPEDEWTYARMYGGRPDELSAQSCRRLKGLGYVEEKFVGARRIVAFRITAEGRAALASLAEEKSE